MAYVDTLELDRPVLQDIGNVSGSQWHDLGYEVRHCKSGKRFRYQKLVGVVTGLGVVKNGTPVGPYIANANATYTINNVSADANLCGHNVTGVARGAPTAASPYFWMEVVDPGTVTTVNVSWVAVAAGNTLVWAGDGYLETISVFNASVCAVAVDAHGTSLSQAGVALDTGQSVTPITVCWL